MNDLDRAIRAIDDYAGPAGDLAGVAGSVAIPLWMLVELRRALDAHSRRCSGNVATAVSLWNSPRATEWD